MIIIMYHLFAPTNCLAHKKLDRGLLWAFLFLFFSFQLLSTAMKLWSLSLENDSGRTVFLENHRLVRSQSANWQDDLRQTHSRTHTSRSASLWPLMKMLPAANWSELWPTHALCCASKGRGGVIHIHKSSFYLGEKK